MHHIPFFQLAAHTKFELLVTDHAKKFKESMESVIIFLYINISKGVINTVTTANIRIHLTFCILLVICLFCNDEECENMVLEERELIALFQKTKETHFVAFDNSLSWADASVKDYHKQNLEQIFEEVFGKIRQENSSNEVDTAKLLSQEKTVSNNF